MKKDNISVSVTAFIIVLLSASCATVKNYPHNKPFIYSNKIILEGNISKDEKKRLTLDLPNYWDDSLKAPRLQKLFLFSSIKNPPVYDTVNIGKSKKFMNAYLNSQGYYSSVFKDSIPKFDTVNKQIRVNMFMRIHLGKNITIDSSAYALSDSNMQQLALKNFSNTFLKKGVPFNKMIITAEKDRITSVFRNNGYYKFSQDDIIAEADTTDKKLLQLSLDPIGQADLLQEAARNRKENPKWDILIKQKKIIDSSKVQRYYIRKIFYYPETRLTDLPDSMIIKNELHFQTRKDLTMYYSEGKFKLKPLREHTYLRRDSLYNESLFYKTLNSFSQIGAWQQVESRVIVSAKDSVDLYFFLVPAPKQNYSIDLEGSRNTGDITTSGGYLLGISSSLSYRNRNVWKQGIQSVTTLRIGTEFSDSAKSLLQTLQFSLSHTYTIPKLIVPFNQWHYLNTLNNKKTVFSSTASYTDRKTYYVIKSFVTGWGYEWNKGNNNWVFKPLNIELYKIDTLSGLITLFKENPFLRNSFRNGNVVGSSILFSRTINSKTNPRISHYFHVGFEESGTLISIFKGVSDQVFRYVKLESEYRFKYELRRGEIVTRLYSGIALPKAGESMPIFKQYFLGGPNSMRAWGLRQLGLGSSITSDTSTSGYTDRFGNFALEANIEYRFNIWDFGTVKLASALYADMGNLWDLNKNPADPNAVFSPSRLGKDLAIGIGSGLRLDANYFLLRLDFAYKVKDPARQTPDGWMDINHLKLTENRSNGVGISDLMFQFGIGLPF